VVRQARATLEALETKAAAGQAQVDLFAAAPADAGRPPPARALTALDALDPDQLSPREALDALYKLKTLAREDLS
jgi:DNA mismatch repair protein MutS